MIRRRRKRGGRLDGFVERTASGSSKVFLLLLLELCQFGDVGRDFCCVWDELFQHRSPSRTCSSLAPGNVSAKDSGPMTGTAHYSSNGTALFFTRHILRLNSPSLRRSRMDLRLRGRSGGIQRDCTKSVPSLSCGRSGVWSCRPTALFLEENSPLD